jgi:hypothetical protein
VLHGICRANTWFAADAVWVVRIVIVAKPVSTTACLAEDAELSIGWERGRWRRRERAPWKWLSMGVRAISTTSNMF